MNFDGQLPYQLWLKLPKEVRNKLAVLFNIKRTGSTVVNYGPNGNTVESDGYKPTDIEAVTLEKMQELLHTNDTNFFGLFERVVNDLDALLAPPIQFDEVLEEIVVKKSFCDSCDSKGGSHKKVCIKYKPAR